MNLTGMLRLLRIKEQKELHIDLLHIIVIYPIQFGMFLVNFARSYNNFIITLKSNLIKYPKSFQMHVIMM